MGIGKTLEQLIKEKNTNVNEVARLAGVSPQTIYSLIKRDSMKINIEVLIKIAQALDVTVDYFYYRYMGVEEPQNKCYTTEEQELVRKYRALDERGKQAVDETLEREYAYTKNFAEESSG